LVLNAPELVPANLNCHGGGSDLVLLLALSAGEVGLCLGDGRLLVKLVGGGLGLG